MGYTMKMAYSIGDHIIGNAEQLGGGCGEQDIFEIVFANQRSLGERKRNNGRGAACKAAIPLEAGKPGFARSLFAKAACPGVVIVEDSYVGRVLITENCGFGLGVVFHPCICVE